MRQRHGRRCRREMVTDTERHRRRIRKSQRPFSYTFRSIACAMCCGFNPESSQSHHARTLLSRRAKENEDEKEERVSDEEEFFVAHLPRADELDWQNDDCVSVMAGSDRIKDSLRTRINRSEKRREPLEI